MIAQGARGALSKVLYEAGSTNLFAPPPPFILLHTIFDRKGIPFVPFRTPSIDK